MSDKTAQLGSKSDQSHVYAIGYDSAMTLELHASRTAERQASWFLPYLHVDMTVLDCGCASGSITIGLAEAVAPGHVTGVDISAVEIERAKARAEEFGLTNVRFEVGDVRNIGFPDGAFDAVFAHNVLEHVADLDAAIEEMTRVLRSGGVIGLRDIDFGGHILAASDPLIAQYHELFETDWRRTGGHPRLGRDLRALLHRAGFVDVIASASYEAYGSVEAMEWWSRIAAGRLSDPDFVARIVNCGLARSGELERMQGAYLAWPHLPDSFCALTHAEVVGRKP